jgi:hypothetical protein
MLDPMDLDPVKLAEQGWLRLCWGEGGIRTKVGTWSYYETFKQEQSSYFLNWAANEKKTGETAANNPSFDQHFANANIFRTV